MRISIRSQAFDELAGSSTWPRPVSEAAPGRSNDCGRTLRSEAPLVDGRPRQPEVDENLHLRFLSQIEGSAQTCDPAGLPNEAAVAA